MSKELKAVLLKPLDSCFSVSTKSTCYICVLILASQVPHTAPLSRAPTLALSHARLHTHTRSSTALPQHILPKGSICCRHIHLPSLSLSLSLYIYICTYTLSLYLLSPWVVWCVCVCVRVRVRGVRVYVCLQVLISWISKIQFKTNIADFTNRVVGGFGILKDGGEFPPLCRCMAR